MRFFRLIEVFDLLRFSSYQGWVRYMLCVSLQIGGRHTFYVYEETREICVQIFTKKKRKKFAFYVMFCCDADSAMRVHKFYDQTPTIFTCYDIGFTSSRSRQSVELRIRLYTTRFIIIYFRF